VGEQLAWKLQRRFVYSILFAKGFQLGSCVVKQTRQDTTLTGLHDFLHLRDIVEDFQAIIIFGMRLL
jgi:hypothetical protein